VRASNEGGIGTIAILAFTRAHPRNGEIRPQLATINHSYEVACSLSTFTDINDLRWPWTAITHYFWILVLLEANYVEFTAATPTLEP